MKPTDALDPDTDKPPADQTAMALYKKDVTPVR